ncbi:CTTNBP2 [Symbiodinium natans]|uniref:CTTNBP2 protein n=1 Tax=Symbiodinium natans TaxID=878477 RepID=A0A812V579_9DINO|nr:CTTNBP2 [Symbiodinium natans]
MQVRGFRVRNPYHSQWIGVFVGTCPIHGPGKTLKVLPAAGKESELPVEEADSLEAFFTPGAGRKCPALAVGSHVLILGKDKMLVIDTVAKAVRVIKHPGWCLCASNGENVYFVNAAGAVHRAQKGLKDETFPGSTTLVREFSGTATAVDCIEPVCDFVKEPTCLLRPRDSGSVITGLCALPGSVLVCKGHGMRSFDVGSATEREILKDERSAMSFAFPSGLFVAGDTIFAQCADGIRQTTVAGGPVSLALPAGDMVFEDDPGSPSPYPKDVIGIDAKYIYFFTERDFFHGMALRRWPHGKGGKGARSAGSAGSASAAMEPAPAGGMEMKVTAKKGIRFYERSAETMLKGLEASTAADGREVAAKPPVQDLRVSALGNAIDVAVAVAAGMEKRGLAKFRRIQTSYAQMEDAFVPQIWIDLQKI